jgi:hypothetical protein
MLLRDRRARVDPVIDGAAPTITQFDRDGVGELAAVAPIVLHELADERPSLKEVFFQPTESAARAAITASSMPSCGC